MLKSFQVRISTSAWYCNKLQCWIYKLQVRKAWWLADACVNNRCKHNIKCMALQFNDANVHFERGIFKAFFKTSASPASVYLHRLHVNVNDVLQNTI